MPYPLILATNGDMFARINPDRTWSVRWDRVLDIVYAKPHPRQVAVQAFAKLLLAAKDNFFTKTWAESARMIGDWDQYEAIIDYADTDPPPNSLSSTITCNNGLIAKVNYDGSWSVKWNEVLEIARWHNDDYRATALIGLCKVFAAAQDRFVTAVWDQSEDEE